MLPLRCSGQHRAPWSPAACTRLLFRLTGLGSIFRSSRCFPSFAFTSRLPVTDPGHSLAFDSLRRVKPTTSSGMDATPALFRPTQRPLAAVLLRQAPPSVVTARCRGDFRSAGLGGAFRCFRSFPLRRFYLAVPSPDGGLRHCFRSLCAGVVRPRPRYARYPSSSGRKSTPWPPTNLRQAPTLQHPLDCSRGPFA